MAKVFTITEGLENMGALKTGGQGSVYKARRMGEIITAVKLLPTPIHSETTDDKHFTAFRNEVNKLKKVNEKPNPNVVKIISSGITETGSFPFIEMEYVEGPDLEELLKPPHDPVFSVKEVIKVADQLAFALAHCHRVDVKHGDIKTNNVKLNINTGNYVLLDFGLSMMSDEQRRTSLRNAGAIEFMAPEQNEGQMLFQTDVYSFGVILYELLAGRVPFPLNDKSESARNKVMVAHLESIPPDILSLRKENIPAGWTTDKKEVEMQVPEWLLNLIYICLQKDPAKRFENGMKLHEYVISKSIHSESKPLTDNDLSRLEQENKVLQQEKEKLEQQVIYYQQRELKYKSSESNLTGSYPPYKAKKKSSKVFYLLLFLLGISAVVFAWYQNMQKSNPQSSILAGITKQKKATGQYKVVASKAFFHDKPDEATRRTAYMIPSTAVVNGLEEENNFIYTEFTNDKGQTSKGWLRKRDLMALADWEARSKMAKPKKLTAEEIKIRLADANELKDRNEMEEAALIYRDLSNMDVPEAMFEYGKMGLQKKTSSLDCAKAYNLVKKSSDKGFAPAKRTLGFLYFFADNPEVLRINQYDNCKYERNVFAGSKLLLEAVLAGDTTAKSLVEELEINIDSSNN
jgi:eukaryotic-like serine/threonine-protein kinase